MYVAEILKITCSNVANGNWENSNIEKHLHRSIKGKSIDD